MLQSPQSCHAIFAMLTGAAIPLTLLHIRENHAKLETHTLHVKYQVGQFQGQPAAQSEVHLPISCMFPNSNSSFCILISKDTEYFHEFFPQHCAWHDGSILEMKWLCDRGGPAEFCQMNIKDLRTLKCSYGMWTALKVGPFYTVGAYEWSGAAALFKHGAVPEYRAGLHAFTDTANGNVDDAGQLIGFPPIHQHHFHFFGSTKAEQIAVQVHSDSQCLPQEGGVDCLCRSAPAGLAYVLADALGFTSEFNDVRQPSAAPLRSWVFLAFKPVPETQPIRQIRVTVANIAVVDTLRTAYKVQLKSNVVTWMNGTFSSNLSSTLESYFHGHPGIMYDLWLFQGTTDTVFSNVTRAAKSYRRSDASDDSIRDMLRNIQMRQLDTKSPPAMLSCSYMTSSGIEMIEVGWGVKEFHRKARCSIDPRTPAWVLIQLNRLRPAAILQPFASVDMFASQHGSLRLYYEGEPNTAYVMEESADIVGEMFAKRVPFPHPSSWSGYKFMQGDDHGKRVSLLQGV